MGFAIGIVIFIVLLIIFLRLSVKIVRQSEVYIIERWGKFHKVANAGLTFIVPFVDRVRNEAKRIVSKHEKHI